MKNPLGVSPSKGYQGTTRGKEKIDIYLYTFIHIYFFYTAKLPMEINTSPFSRKKHCDL